MSASTKLLSKDGIAPGDTVTKRSLCLRYGILVSCIAMLLLNIDYRLSGGTFDGLFGNLALVACVGMCFGLHRLAGKFCHGVSSVTVYMTK